MAAPPPAPPPPVPPREPVGHAGTLVVLGVAFLAAVLTTAAITRANPAAPRGAAFLIVFLLTAGGWLLASLQQLGPQHNGGVTFFGQPARVVHSGLIVVWAGIETLYRVPKTRMELGFESAGLITKHARRRVQTVDLEGNPVTKWREFPSIVVVVDSTLYITIGDDEKNIWQLIQFGPPALFKEEITLAEFIAILQDNLEEIVLSEVRTVAGTMDFMAIINQRRELGERVTAVLRAQHGQTFDLLGVDENSIELHLKHVELPDEVKRGLSSEQTAISTAQATAAKAAGDKIAQIRAAEAEREELRLRAEGDALAISAKAEAIRAAAGEGRLAALLPALEDLASKGKFTSIDGAGEVLRSVVGELKEALKKSP